ncbi:glycoside hydrolase family 10 protein [Deinococcus sonorensis]|uniref:Family 10 glycosylhydrolase n=2 Tax=Deinococcus sonorensis TaxID=309891 RepID=A0AAU7U8U9_9DEIO
MLRLPALAALLTFGLAFASAPVLPPLPVLVPSVPTETVPPTPAAGLRGLWLDGFGPGLMTRAQATRAVNDAAALGVNTLFVQSIRRADCLCLRASVPPVGGLEPGFDPLETVIQLAHARHMRVIGWISVTGAWNSSVPSRRTEQVFQQHGPDAGLNSWLARRPDGSWKSGADAWLDPGIPAAADFMAGSALSLVTHYDLDGLQLDRIRYPDGGDWGYSPVTLARYRLETGARGVPAATDERWRSWKRAQVTALTRRIALEARGARPGILISAATIVYGDGPTDLNGFHATRSYAEVLQDWPAWMAEGLLDLNVMMNYKRDGVGDQAAWFDHWNTFAASLQRPGAAVAAGTAMYLNSPAVTAAQAGRATALGLGWVGYAYRTPTAAVYAASQTQPQGFAAVQAALQSQDGSPLPAPLAWSPPSVLRRAVLGRVVGLSQPGGVPVEVYAPDGQLLGRTTTDGNGYYGFADLNGERAEVRVGDQRWTESLQAGLTRFPNLLLRQVTRVND